MKLIKLFTCLVLWLTLLSGCGGGSGSGGGSGNAAIYEANIAGTTFYLAKKSDHFLLYREHSQFNCFIFTRMDIVSTLGHSYFVDGGANDGQLVEFSYDQGVYTVYTADSVPINLEFTRNGQTEADIKPKCGNPQAQGEVSVAITFQQLPDTIRRTVDDFYEWKVTFDMDNDMQTSPGDLYFTVNSFLGPDPSTQQTSIEDIGAELFVYYSNGASSGIGAVSLVVDGNTMIISAPKSLYTGLEDITTQTQINVSAGYSDGLIYHSDYLPGSDQFTAVMDTSDIADTLNDQSGSAALVDIVNVSVTSD